MKRFKVLSIALMALAMLLTPYAGFAQAMPDPGPGYDIQVEFRYTAGEEGNLNVPSAITRFGRNYHLVDKKAPVLESSLPVTRNYTWYIEGVLSESEKKQYENIEGVTLKPVEVLVKRIVDKERSTTLPVNDVDLINFSELFDIRSDTSPTGVEAEDLRRAAVKFEVLTEDDGLPTSYKATVVYRGLETFMEAGHYEVKSTYKTSENIGSVPQYVVVATYAPDNPPVTPVPVGPQPGPTVTPPDDGTTTPPDDGTTPQPPPDDGTTIPPPDTPIAPPDDTTIKPPDTPVTPPTKPFSIVTLIPLFIAIGFAVCCILLLQKERERMRDSEAKREARRKAAQRAHHGLTEFD